MAPNPIKQNQRKMIRFFLTEFFGAYRCGPQKADKSPRKRSPEHPKTAIAPNGRRAHIRGLTPERQSIRGPEQCK
jgi:hypothetical protein